MRKTFCGKTIPGACVGCSTVSDRALLPGGVILENTHFILHQDPEVPVESFFVITAKRHVRYLPELTEEELRALHEMVSKARAIAGKLDVAEQYTLLLEERSAHLHIWLFPRLPWMYQYEDSVSSIREIMKDAKDCKSGQREIDGILHTVEQAKEIARQL